MTTEPTSSATLFAMWQNGAISNAEALRALCEELRGLETTLATIAVQRDALRDQIGQIVVHAGGKLSLPGIGRLEITQPSVTITYERTALEPIIIGLTATHPAIAAQLAACRKERQRAGALRITPEPVRR